jgi:hypothetical protein
MHGPAELLAARIRHDTEAAVPAEIGRASYLLHPSITETNAEVPAVRGAGKRSNFSISGKLTSTCARPVRRSSAIISGSRCSVCGPNTRSTNGARAAIASPSWLATHPPTPISTCGRCAFSRRHSPSSENTFSWAFSRTEQVFISRTSAWAGSSVGVRPTLTRSTSAMRAESYSFIWQPKVLM